jgi:hypothetical protein
MTKRAIAALTALCGLILGTFFLGSSPGTLPGQVTALAQNHDFSDQQITGPYDVVKDWPKAGSNIISRRKGLDLGIDTSRLRPKSKSYFYFHARRTADH